MHTKAQLELLNHFNCPFTKKLIEDPVTAACGHSFEKFAVEKKFKNSTCIECPTCKSIIFKSRLVPNLALKLIIQNYVVNANEYHKEEFLFNQNIDIVLKIFQAEPALLSNTYLLNLIAANRIKDLFAVLNLFPAKLKASLNDAGYTVLHVAIVEQKLELVKALVAEFEDEIDVNICITSNENETYTALQLAAFDQYSTAEIVKFLAESGANTATPSRLTDCTPLILALGAGKYDRAMALIQSQKDLNINHVVKSKHGYENYSAILIAAKEAPPNIFVELTKINDINVNAKNPSTDEAALHIVARAGSLEKLQALFIVPNININLTCQGKTAWQIAETEKQNNIVAFHSCYRLLLLLISGENILDQFQWNHLALLDEKSLEAILTYLNNTDFDTNKVNLVGAIIKDIKGFVRNDNLHSDNLMYDENTVFHIYEKLFATRNIDNTWKKEIHESACNKLWLALHYYDDLIGKLELLKWAKTNPLFYNQGLYFFSNKNVDMIDSMILSTEELLKQQGPYARV